MSTSTWSAGRRRRAHQDPVGARGRFHEPLVARHHEVVAVLDDDRLAQSVDSPDVARLGERPGGDGVAGHQPGDHLGDELILTAPCDGVDDHVHGEERTRRG